MNKADKNKPLIIISGPTAVGKSEISVKLAALINGEIISADSMQVYRGMDIGTAKITRSEMKDIPHHLIDILDAKEDFNIVSFKTLAQDAIDEIYKKGNLPIIVGGTGFYIQSVLYDIDFSYVEESQKYREELALMAKENGNEYLHDKLKKVDPVSAKKIHANDLKRVIRALEFYNQTGQCISEHNENESQNQSPYNFCYFVLSDDRETIYDKINRRVDLMIESGLVDEVRKLKESGLDSSYVSMKGLGYKEILEYLDGEISLDEAVYKIKRDSRHFAKRQLTWFKREKEVVFINRKDLSEEEILNEMIGILKEKRIIE